MTRTISRKIFVASILAAAAASAASAHAATITWTGGASNVWDSAALNWTGGATTYTDGDTVTFDDSGANPAITIAAPVAPASVTVNNSSVDYSFSGSAITAGSLTKSGAGKLTLNAANSYAGGTTINAGTVQINNAGALGTTGTINLGSASAGTNNASLLTSVSFTRALTVQAGNNGTATFGGSNTSGTINYSGIITLNKALTISQAAGGNLTFTSGFNVTGAQDLTFSPGAGSTINMNFLLSSGGAGKTLTINGPGALELGSLYNPAATNLGAAGTKLVLTQGRLQGVSGVSFNSLANLVEINGNFALGSITAADKRSITFGNATPVKFNAASPQTIEISTATNRQIVFAGGGAQFDQNVTFNPAGVSTGSRLQFTGGMTLSGSRTVTINSGLDAAVVGALVGNGYNLTLQGTSTTVGFGSGAGIAAAAVTGATSPRIIVDGPTVNFSRNDSTFTGGVTVQSGTITISNSSVGANVSGPVGTGTLILAGGTVTTDSTSRTLTNAVTIANNFTFVARPNSTTLTFTGPVTVSSNPTVTQSASGNNGSILQLQNLVLNSNATFDGLDAIQLSPNITANRSISSTGAGLKSIVGSISGAGSDLTLAAGNFTINATTGASSPKIVVNGATATFNSTASTFNGGVKLVSGTVVLNVAGLNNGLASSPLGIGAFRVEGGTVTTGSAGGVPLPVYNNFELAGSATLTDNNGQGQRYSGSTTISNNPTLNATAFGGIVIDNTTLQSDLSITGSGAFSGTSSVAISSLDLNGNRTLTGTNTSGLGISLGNISGTSSSLTISATSTSTFRISGASSYDGATTLNGGITRLLNNSALPTATALTVGNGGILELNGYQQTVSSLSGGATGIIRSASSPAGAGAQLTVNNASANTYNGLFNEINGNTVALIKNGAGSLTLASATHTGLNSITINQGTVYVNGSITAAGGAVTVNNTGTFAGSGTIGTLTVNNGGTLAPGNSPGNIVSTGATFNAGSSFNVEINGNTFTSQTNTQYDRLTISPNIITLDTSGAGVTLNATLGYSPVNTDKIWIAELVNKFSHTSGNFFNLAQGATVNLGAYNNFAYTANISYTGNIGTGATSGSGDAFNDIVLYNFVGTPLTSSTTYTLAASTTVTNLLVGGKGSVNSTLTNTGTGSADTINYTGLTGTSGNNGVLTAAGSGSGNNVANNNGTGTQGVTITGQGYGSTSVTSAVGSATNSTLATPATFQGTAGFVTINVGNATAKVGGGFDPANVLTAAAGFTVAGLSSKVVVNSSLGAFQSQATLLEATAATNATDISMNWRQRTTAESTPGNPITGGNGRHLGSDVVELLGVTGNPSLYTLQMKYDSSDFANNDAAEISAAQHGFLYLGWLDDQGTLNTSDDVWVNAGTGNPVLGGYILGTDFQLGLWGIDAANDVVWAVVNHNSEFAAVVPEPASLGLLALGGLALLNRRRRA